MELAQEEKSLKQKKREYRQRSFSRELTISLSLLLLFFQGVLLAYVYNSQSRLIQQNLETVADDFSRNLHDALVVPILNLDDQQIRKIGKSFLKNEVIDEIHLRNSQDETILRVPGGKDLRRHLLRSIDILYQNQVIGHVDLWFSMSSVERDLTRLRNTIVLVLLLSGIMTFAATAILLHVFMHKPLEILQKGADRMAGGDYACEFDSIHHHELSGIAAGFKEMAADIQAREYSAQEINESLRDEISARTLAEEKIRDSEAKCRALLDAIPDVVFQIDRQGCLLDFHGTHKDLFPAPQRLIGQKIDKIFPPDLAELHHKKVEQTLVTRQLQIFEYELPINGNKSYFESRMAAIPDGTGSIMTVVCDITRIKQGDADKIRLEEQLHGAQKMEAVGRLAGGAAHDLNNALSGLVSYPELILMDLSEDSPLHPSILAIQKSGEKATKVVQDMLALARRGVSVSEMVNLNDTITDYFLTPEYEKLKKDYPKVKLEINIDPDLQSITGSYLHLAKMVTNLVINAAETMPEGGTVTICSQNRYIDKPIRGYNEIEEGNYAILTVSDNGIGISDQDLKRIFEPFYTKKTMGRSGSGLEMAVVMAAVEDHNGYIDANCTEDRKTTFSVYLPARRQSPSRKETRFSMETRN